MMTDQSREERIRLLEERRRRSTAGENKGKSRRNPHAVASRIAVLGASTTMMLGIMAGMGLNPGVQAATSNMPPATAVLASNTATGGVLEQTRSGVAAVPAPATRTPLRQLLSITRSGGSR